MHLFKKIFFSFGLLLTSLAFADDASAPAATAPSNPTLNYQIIPADKWPKNFTVPAHQILVYDFFSYGCPHCYRLSPSLEQWRTQKAPYILFQPVPVAFEPGWDTLSKAYHIADMLGIEPTLHAQIFDIAQNPLLGLGSDAQLRSFFLNHGVAAVDYDKAANDPALAQALQNDQTLMKNFSIMEIPTVIVADGKNIYYISNRTVANADPTLFVQTLTQLTAKRP